MSSIEGRQSLPKVATFLSWPPSATALDGQALLAALVNNVRGITPSAQRAPLRLERAAPAPERPGRAPVAHPEGPAEVLAEIAAPTKDGVGDIGENPGQHKTESRRDEEGDEERQRIRMGTVHRDSNSRRCPERTQ